MLPVHQRHMARLGFEPRSSGYEPDVEPLHYRAEPCERIELSTSVWKTGMLPLHQQGKSTEPIPEAGPYHQPPLWPLRCRPDGRNRTYVTCSQGRRYATSLHPVNVSAVLRYGWSRLQDYLAPPDCASPPRAPPAAPLKEPFSRLTSFSRCCDAAVPPTKTSSSA